MTFRVDGVSLKRIRERIQSATDRVDKGAFISMAEWEAMCERKAEAAFATAKAGALGTFSTPRLMNEFYDLCASKPSEFRDLRRMELYRTAAVDPKTKEPITAWREYTGRAAQEAGSLWGGLAA
jgi:hypothetical protein